MKPPSEHIMTMTAAPTMRWGVIFDWDGVILDSSSQHEHSWERLAEEEGFTLPADHFKRGFGMKNETIIPELLGWTRDPQAIRRLATRKEELYRQIVREDGVSLIPGARELLGALTTASVPCGVGSSTPKPNITFALQRLGLEECFAAVVAAEDVSRGKPDPQVFLLAAQRLRLPAARCVVFEDTPVGIAAARAAGMKAVGVATTYPADALREADCVVHRLDELGVPALRELVHTPSSTRSGTIRSWRR